MSPISGKRSDRPADESQEKYKQEIIVSSASPLENTELHGHFNGAVIHRPGIWLLDLVWQGEILMSRRIPVRLKGETPPGSWSE